jgi:hypothetical protein
MHCRRRLADLGKEYQLALELIDFHATRKRLVDDP